MTAIIVDLLAQSNVLGKIINIQIQVGHSHLIKIPTNITVALSCITQVKITLGKGTQLIPKVQGLNNQSVFNRQDIANESTKFCR